MFVEFTDFRYARAWDVKDHEKIQDMETCHDIYCHYTLHAVKVKCTREGNSIGTNEFLFQARTMNE